MKNKELQRRIRTAAIAAVARTLRTMAAEPDNPHRDVLLSCARILERYG